MDDKKQTRQKSSYNIPDYSVTESIINKSYSDFRTISEKIEPLIDTQSILSSRIASLDNTLFDGAKVYNDDISNILSPLTGSAKILGDSINQVGRMAIDSKILFDKASYDFINNPLSATLNTAIDTIEINQNRLAAFIHDADTISDYLTLSKSSEIINTDSLGSIAIESLKSSPFLFPIEREGKIKDIEDKVNSLETKINQLTEEKNNLSLTDITKDVSDELERIDLDLAKCFRGAITTLIKNDNEDLVGQVAESLTRVVENLPLKLAGENIKYSSSDKEVMIGEALGAYLKIKNNDQSKYHLIAQQKNFYATLGSIRHRNLKIYNNDVARFKAFIVQVEAYIYILLTFNNEN